MNNHPRIMFRLTALTTLLPLLLVAKLPEEARLLAASEVLQKTPLSVPELNVLSEYVRNSDNPPVLRSRAMAAYAMALLLQGNTNNFVRAQQAHRTAYPGDARLIPLTAEHYSVPCDACNGTGQREKTVCPQCFGRGSQFQLSPLVAQTYKERLGEIAAQCRENAEYAEKFREATKTSYDDRRIELLQALTNSYPHRTDLTPAIAMLNDALAKREARIRAAQEQEARQCIEREAKALKILARGSDRPRAIRELRAFLDAHPYAAPDLELQAVLDKLVAKEEQRQRLVKIGIGLAVLTGCLFLVSVIRFFSFPRRTSASVSLPGMDKIDKAEFTDPLSLTAQDSLARAKYKTARIPREKAGVED